MPPLLFSRNRYYLIFLLAAFNACTPTSNNPQASSQNAATEIEGEKKLFGYEAYAMVKLGSYRVQYRWFGGNVLKAFNANPTILTKEQAINNPVLLIHGNFSDDTSMVEIAKTLATENIPTFTVNLASGYFRFFDMKVIEAKWKSIQDLYAQANVPSKQLKISVIGHSRGGGVAFFFMRPSRYSSIEKERCYPSVDISYDFKTAALRENLGDIVIIGNHITSDPCSEQLVAGHQNHIYELNGTSDYILTALSPNWKDPDQLIPTSNKILFSLGHCSLVIEDSVKRWILNHFKNHQKK